MLVTTDNPLGFAFAFILFETRRGKLRACLTAVPHEIVEVGFDGFACGCVLTHRSSVTLVHFVHNERAGEQRLPFGAGTCAHLHLSV